MKITGRHIGMKAYRECWADASDSVTIDSVWVHQFGHVPDWILVSPEQEGLSLLKAMESGRPFRKVGTDLWLTMHEGFVRFYDDTDSYYGLSPERLVARYELKPEPKKVEVTGKMIDDFREGFFDSEDIDEFIEYLKKELGLD